MDLVSWSRNFDYKINFNQNLASKLDVHSVAVITLSPHHPVLKYELPIESISFSGGRKTDRLANKVSGKRKHGGQQLVESSVICTLKCRTRSSTSSCSPSSTGLKSCLTPSSSSPSAGELMPKTCLELKSELGKEDQSLEQQSLDPGLSESPNRSISNFINPSRSSDDDANNRKGDADTKSLSDNGSMEDESMFTYYPIVAGMKGTLVEVNEKLISNPHLIVNEVRSILSLDSLFPARLIVRQWMEK